MSPSSASATSAPIHDHSCIRKKTADLCKRIDDRRAEAKTSWEKRAIERDFYNESKSLLRERGVEDDRLSSIMLLADIKRTTRMLEESCDCERCLNSSEANERDDARLSQITMLVPDQPKDCSRLELHGAIGSYRVYRDQPYGWLSALSEEGYLRLEGDGIRLCFRSIVDQIAMKKALHRSIDKSFRSSGLVGQNYAYLDKIEKVASLDNCSLLAHSQHPTTEDLLNMYSNAMHMSPVSWDHGHHYEEQIAEGLCALSDFRCGRSDCPITEGPLMELSVFEEVASGIEEEMT